MRVQPITCYRPAPHAAETFAALPYDVFNRAEAAAYVADHPGSFLAIDRPETAFGPDQDMYAPEVYTKAGELIRAKAYEGTLLKDTTPCFYLYRLEMDGRSQLGVVAACSVAEYESSVIKRHEKTRPNKTADRVQHIRATGAQTGPVFLTYRDNAAIDIIVSVARPVAVDALVDAFSLVPCAYIADGHHRASAAAQVAHDLRAEAGDPEDELPSDMFLAVLFPASQLYVMPYNRVVVDTAGLDEDALLDAIAQAGFEVGAAQTEPVEPDEARRFGLYAFGSWHELRYVGEAPDASVDPAGSLDVSILQERVLEPILGIDDPRTSKRIQFVGGIEGTAGLERRAGTDGLAFSLCPTTVDQLMAVSDADELMPPKSTWFEPKLRSGLFIRRV
ncbi:MAG: DUF1015 domain-containing protein [Atopobiaceae bacterium]|nr:DUF1015 domain-containing protein [Atopobiaceae bacterium]